MALWGHVTKTIREEDVERWQPSPLSQQVCSSTWPRRRQRNQYKHMAWLRSRPPNNRHLETHELVYWEGCCKTRNSPGTVAPPLAGWTPCSSWKARKTITFRVCVQNSWIKQVIDVSDRRHLLLAESFTHLSFSALSSKAHFNNMRLFWPLFKLKVSESQQLDFPFFF